MLLIISIDILIVLRMRALLNVINEARKPGAQEATQEARETRTQEARRPESQEAKKQGGQEARKPRRRQAKEPGFFLVSFFLSLSVSCCH